MRLPPNSPSSTPRPGGSRPAAWLATAAASALALLLGACAQPPAAPGAQASPQPPAAQTQGGIPAGIVSITYADPAKMSDARISPGISPGARRAWLDALCLYLADRAAPLLPPGQLLEVRLSDVQRAVPGGTPPRIDLDFILRTDSGRVLRQGHRQLGDASTAAPPSARPAAAPLAAEKALLDAWLRSEFRSG